MTLLKIMSDASVFGGRKWKEFTVLAKANAAELLWKMEKAKRFEEEKRLRDALARWGHWLEMYKKNQAGRWS